MQYLNIFRKKPAITSLISLSLPAKNHLRFLQQPLVRPSHIHYYVFSLFLAKSLEFGYYNYNSFKKDSFLKTCICYAYI